MHKAMQNVEIEMVTGSLKVISNGTIRYSAYDFLFEFNRNNWQVVHTYLPLSPSSITWYQQGAVTLCGWEGKNRPCRK